MKTIRRNLLLLAMVWTSVSFGEEPVPKQKRETEVIPKPGDVIRYERDTFFQLKEIPKSKGDALLALLDEGRGLKPFPHRPYDGTIGCLPPTRVWITVFRKDGKPITLGYTTGGGLWVGDDYLCPIETVEKKLAQIIDSLEDDLKNEITNARKPCVYTLGTVPGDGTLWGLSRLFYGTGTKWRAIYEANRNVIENPNSVPPGTTLTIPKLP